MITLAIFGTLLGVCLLSWLYGEIEGGTGDGGVMVFLTLILVYIIWSLCVIFPIAKDSGDTEEPAKERSSFPK